MINNIIVFKQRTLRIIITVINHDVVLIKQFF